MGFEVLFEELMNTKMTHSMSCFHFSKKYCYSYQIVNDDFRAVD